MKNERHQWKKKMLQADAGSAASKTLHHVRPLRQGRHVCPGPSWLVIPWIGPPVAWTTCWGPDQRHLVTQAAVRGRGSEALGVSCQTAAAQANAKAVIQSHDLISFSVIFCPFFSTVIDFALVLTKLCVTF